ncbi:hypothetical protein [Nannocystis pusilla]|uniref:hypothetical protein n=1 Tax=Nannocystis pusilla TaxID=889268 RepID=UPI003B82730A
MTAAEALDKILVRWKPKAAARHSPEYIEGFIRRNRDALERAVARAMMLRRMKRGAPPKTPDEFEVYAKLVARERPKDQEPDADVIKRIMRRMDKLLARDKGPAGQEAALALGVEFADIRAEAILLRRAGWDAVPLLLRRPALAIVRENAVVAVRDSAKALHVNLPEFGEKLNADLGQVQGHVAQLRDGIADAARLDRYANALWTRARAATAPASPAREFETPADLRGSPGGLRRTSRRCASSCPKSQATSRPRICKRSRSTRAGAACRSKTSRRCCRPASRPSRSASSTSTTRRRRSPRRSSRRCARSCRSSPATTASSARSSRARGSAG